MKKRIIIDTDMGSDEYIAIQLAILSNKFNIEGISLVHGNTSMENVKKNIFKTLDMIGKNNTIKVYEGKTESLKDFNVVTDDFALGSNGFGDVLYEPVLGKFEKQNAIDWMIEHVNKNPKKITLVAMGPLTNMASAILKDENFAKNIKELIIMGGAINFGNITPYAEFNFYNDPKAADIVFSSGIKNIVMIGFDITKYVTITTKLENLFKNSKNQNAKFIYDITRTLADIDRKETHVDGAVISDAINICYLLNKKVLKLKKANIKIVLDDMKHLGESKIIEGKPNCKVAVGINSKLCTYMIFSTLLPELKKEIKKLL